jgi:hypothetical protein
MMRAVVAVVAFAVAVAGVVYAQPKPIPEMVRIQMPNSTARDILHLYETLTQRKVWLDLHLDFDRRISIDVLHEMHRGEAIALIQRTFLDQGIEIRDFGDSEAFVSAVKPR